MPALHTLWRVNSDMLILEWLYGRVRTKNRDGWITRVAIAIEPNTLLRDYVDKDIDESTRYFETYQEATGFLKKKAVLRTIELKKIWLQARKYEHGVGIPKATRV